MAVGIGATSPVNYAYGNSPMTAAFTSVGATSAMFVGANPSSGSVTGITDNASTHYTWTRIGQITGLGTACVDCWLGVGGSGGSFTVTATASPTTNCGMNAYEITGADATNPLQSWLPASNISGTVSSFTGPTMTPQSAGCLVIVFMAGSNITSNFPTSPWTSDTTLAYAGASYQAGVTQGTGYSTSYTTTSGFWGDVGAVGVVFQPAYTRTMPGFGATPSVPVRRAATW